MKLLNYKIDCESTSAAYIDSIQRRYKEYNSIMDEVAKKLSEEISDNINKQIITGMMNQSSNEHYDDTVGLI